MCLEHPACHEVMVQMGLSQKMSAWVINEAHCISQWGGDFRPTYGKLDQLCAIIHSQTLILALSATATPQVLEEIEMKTHILPTSSYHLNLGNNRPNIKQVVVEMKNKEDYDVLDNILDLGNVTSLENIPKTLIFTNTHAMTMKVWRYIRDKLCGRVDSNHINFLHAYRRWRGRERMMQ